MLNGGTSNGGNPGTYKVTTDTITLKAAVRKGYTFAGWYSDSARTKKVTTIAKGSTGNKTFYAKWTINTYTIKYVLNGGTSNGGNPSTYKVTTDTITLKAAVRKGYTFVGWFSDSARTKQVKTIAKGSTGNKTFYAKWTPNKYTIKFNGNGATSGTLADKSCTYGISYTLAANPFKRTGYTFQGWNTRKDCSGTAYANKATVSNLAGADGAVLTFYAQWKPISYTVKFNGNEANAYGYYVDTKSSVKDMTCEYNKIYPLSPVGDYFYYSSYLSFTGWNTKPKGDGKAIADCVDFKNLTTTNGAVITLYAQWKVPVNSLTIFDEDVTIGYPKVLDVDVYPSNHTDTLTFTSSDPTIAKVDQTGKVTGFKTGKVTITVKASSGKKDTCTVKVVKNEANWHASRKWYDYDEYEDTLAWDKLYYQGSDLILEAVLCNNHPYYTMDKFDEITFWIYDSNDKTLVDERTLTNISLGVSPYNTKTVKFTFKNVPIRDIADAYGDHAYIYTYHYN